MPALTGAVVSTITDGTGAPVFVIYEFFDPATNLLRDATQTTSRGARTGALIVDNQTGRPQRITVLNADTGSARNINVTANGVALTVAQLAALAPPDGPITTIQDLAGISPSLT
jgi:hypothetical protein